MCTRTITTHITVLTSLLFLFIGCAGPTLTVEEEYDRQEANIQIAMEYDNKNRDCRGSGGLMVVPLPRIKRTDAKLSLGQMRWARCSSYR
jgi:hypothetical protein